MQTVARDGTTNRDHHLADQRKHRLTNANNTTAIYGCMLTFLSLFGSLPLLPKRVYRMFILFPISIFKQIFSKSSIFKMVLVFPLFILLRMISKLSSKVNPFRLRLFARTGRGTILSNLMILKRFINKLTIQIPSFIP